MNRALLFFAVTLICSAVVLMAQTSQATLAGEVRDAQDQPVAGARVAATHEDTGRVITATSNEHGQYVLQFLPLGRYLLRVQARGFRPLVRADIELHVAQRESADFKLETLPPGVDPGAFAPGDAGAGVGLIYGPDAQRKIGVVDDRPPILTDATSSTVSGVIDEHRVHELPLNGRDIYTLFVVMPGVTSDNATRRGLGFSVNGFPVSSSNYLLDGLDNNNVQTTSPVTLLSPDAVQEYRLATSNFSAEYGRGAFVANVVTRAGGNRWHGQLFEFLINEKLSAGAFQDNAAGRPKPPFKEHQFGFTLGGPLRRDRAFFFTSLEPLLASTRNKAEPYTLPSPSFIARVSGPIARDLFQRFPARILSQATAPDADHLRGFLALPLPFSSIAASARADFDMRPDRDSVFIRFGSFNQEQVSLVSPYRGLETPFVISTRSLGAGHIHRFGSSRVNEAKIGWSHNLNERVPPVPGVGQLQTLDRTALPGNVDSFSEQSYTDNVFHGVENLSLLLRRHHIVAGGDYQSVWNRNLLGPDRIGLFGFASLADFAVDRPLYLITSIDRFRSTTPRAPDFTRSSRHNEFGLFVQDNWRVTPRLTLNLGLRYESFGAPAPELNFLPGSGSSPAARIAAGTLPSSPAGFARDANNFAPRFGAAFDLFGNSKTIVRAGYGVYYDRVFQLVFDSLRQNAYVSQFFPNDQTSLFRYASPASSALPASAPAASAAPASFVDSHLRTPYVQTWFAGVQHAASRNTMVEVDFTTSRGRQLIARDLWNRSLGNPAVQRITATTNQGSSDFSSLQSSVFRRFSGGLLFHAAWTWSHAIDNQGDPLVSTTSAVRAFQREFDSAGDRGNADFDQRHNVIFNWIWRTPPRNRWIGHWQLAGIAGYRSGFPFTVFSDYFGSGAGGQVLVQPPASLTGSRYARATPTGGGMILLDRAAFIDASGNGNTTRGEFRGPGFWNYDASLSREFPLPQVWKFGEASRLQFRAEFFNLFNHANLGAPDSRLNSPNFGVAFFGRAGASSSTVGTSPLSDFPRRIQLVLRLSF